MYWCAQRKFEIKTFILESTSQPLQDHTVTGLLWNPMSHPKAEYSPFQNRTWPKVEQIIYFYINSNPKNWTLTRCWSPVLEQSAPMQNTPLFLIGPRPVLEWAVFVFGVWQPILITYQTLHKTHFLKMFIASHSGQIIYCNHTNPCFHGFPLVLN